MAKTIKFNLICNNKPIRTIEDLQNNFVIEDVLDYYNKKLLHRWLKVRGYEAELKKVEAIESKETLDIIEELIEIFDMESDTESVEKIAYTLEYLVADKAFGKEGSKQNSGAKKIIDDYFEGYKKRVDDIIENPDDAELIKANLAEITKNYKWAFQFDHRNLFYALEDKSPLAIMCLLMNENSRNYYLPKDKKDNNDMYNVICNMIYTKKFENSLGRNLRSSSVHSARWKPLFPKGEKYMIISTSNTYICLCSAGCRDQIFSSEKLKNAFVILDGIDCQSYYRGDVLYMEV